MKKITGVFILIALTLICDNAMAQKNKKALYTAPFGVQAYTFRKSFPIDVAKLWIQ